MCRSRRYMLRRVTNEPMTTRADLQRELELQGVKVSRKTVSRELHQNGLNLYTPRRTPLLTVKHIKKRLEFAKNHVDEDIKFWEQVAW